MKNIAKNTITLDANGYYATIYRGTSYLLRVDGLGRYEVSTQRLHLRGIPGVKHFDSAAEVAKNVKAFANIETFIDMTGPVQ